MIFQNLSSKPSVKRAFLFLAGLLFCSASTLGSSLNSIVFLGDSLTEGYGVARERAFPALVEQMIAKSTVIKKSKTPSSEWRVINSGITGSTSASGVQRMQWILKSKPKIVVVALGANDMLRGFDSSQTKKNLAALIEVAQKDKIQVLLVGMEAPPNYGEDYGKKFRSVFPELARSHNIPLMPFLLENVAGKKELNLPDGIHPNEAGHEIMAKALITYLEAIIKKIE